MTDPFPIIKSEPPLSEECFHSVKRSNKKPRILFYSDIYEPTHGGLVTSLKRILTGLSRLNEFEIHLLTYNESLAKKQPQLTKEGFYLHGHGLGEGKVAYLYIQSSTKRIIHLHKTYQFDLFVAFFANMPLLTVATAASAFDKPYIVCARGSDININMSAPLYRQIMRDYIRDSHCMLCVSDKMSKCVRKWRLAPGNKLVMTANNSIDHTLFSNAHRIRRSMERFAYDFIFVGHARPVKRFDLIIDATRRLKQQGVKARLAAVMVPHRKHPGLIDEYKSTVKKHKLTDMITFINPMQPSKLRKLYAQSKCCIIASDSEGCSNAMLESMATGCHIIARKCVIPKKLLHKHNIAFDSVDELAEAMNNVLKSNEKVVTKNIDLLQTFYSNQSEIDTYRKLFHEAIS